MLSLLFENRGDLLAYYVVICLFFRYCIIQRRDKNSSKCRRCNDLLVTTALHNEAK